VTQFSQRDVIDLGSELAYVDGVEGRIMEILEGARDRSSTSDELASHITDWPSRYHFSRLRRNLFEPFRIGPDMRVLEIGCGMGANLVTLAETGAEVVGVEGSMSRAKAARVRTSHQPNVTVYAGDVAKLPALAPFDLVVMVGVLEYSMTGAGGAGGPTALLDRASSLLRPGGSLILAIENQLGLKYLLSYPEDHHAQPWVGLEGYSDRGGPRTWSRRALSALVEDAGLPDQSWLYPYPDYKLPTFIARHRLFETEPGLEVIRQFLRNPVVDFSGSPMFVCDPASALSVMLTARLGPDTANSFLLVASGEPGTSDALLRDGEAWTSSGERVQEFRSQRVITADAGQFYVHERSGPSIGQPGSRTWLRNVGHPTQVVHPGRCLEDLLVEAIRADDLETLRSLLRTYDEFLRCNRQAVGSDPTNPFLLDIGRETLPGDFLDCSFKNLIVADGEPPHYVDREWAAAGGVDEELVRIRSYFELALRIALTGVDHPWNPMMTVGDLVQTLRREVAEGWTDEELRSFSVAEDELQRIVVGQPNPQGVEEVLGVRLMDRLPSMPMLSLLRRADSSEAIRADLIEARERQNELTLANEQLTAANDQVIGAHHQLSLEHADLAVAYQEFHDAAQDQIGRLESELRAVGEDRDGLRALIGETVHARDSLAAEVEAIRRSRSYRWGRTLTLPARAFKRR
jgi:SAM-dependent methyltransferase